MKKNIKVVVIGAGSADFGQGAVADWLTAIELKDFDIKMVLVDIDKDALDRMFEFSKVLKDYYKSNMTIEATMDRAEALPGADYVITAVSRRRWDLWQKDFFIPAVFGFRQVFGENGGPGGCFHTLRSLNLMIPIAKDMEKYCPDAFLLNYTNPESRVCLAVSKLTKIRNVGLCHGPLETLEILSQILDIPEENIDMTIGGINHFHWVLKISNKKDGKDLYPVLDEKLKTYKWDPADPLSSVLYKIFGLFPFPAPSHPDEYMNFAKDIGGPNFLYWGIGSISRKLSAKVEELDYVIEGISNRPSYELWSNNQVERIKKALKGEIPLSDKDLLLKKDLTEPSREIAIPIICGIEFNLNNREIGANVLNKEYAISNLREDAVVEIPIRVNAEGIHPEKVGPLPSAIAGLCSIQTYIQDLLVEAYDKKSKNALLQAILIDPFVDDIERAKKMMETMLKVEEEYLPELK
jgi:alpha-galactosidase